jgi:hypothetical protein
MRINGRLLRPSSLAERRTMLSLGLTTTFRCPRTENPYAVARRLRRLAEGKNTDADYLRGIGQRKRPTSSPELPDSRPNEEAAA